MDTYLNILLTPPPLIAHHTRIDSILGARAGDGSEHEASRRMKTELLVQMDGISSKGGKQKKGALPPQVFVMAASNMPWDLDVAGETHTHIMHWHACVPTWDVYPHHTTLALILPPPLPPSPSLSHSHFPLPLSPTVLRRLEKRVLVPLPPIEAREQMLRNHLQGRVVTGEGQAGLFSEYAGRTEGYSGADLELLCREAAMR
jgi:katanin p60 ATPase-containing subunit A1